MSEKSYSARVARMKPLVDRRIVADIAAKADARIAFLEARCAELEAASRGLPEVGTKRARDIGTGACPEEAARRGTGDADCPPCHAAQRPEVGPQAPSTVELRDTSEFA